MYASPFGLNSGSTWILLERLDLASVRQTETREFSLGKNRRDYMASCFRLSITAGTGLCLNSNFFSAYLCVPLRLCGKCARTTCLPQRRRGTQRYAEKIRHHPKIGPRVRVGKRRGGHRAHRLMKRVSSTV